MPDALPRSQWLIARPLTVVSLAETPMQPPSGKKTAVPSITIFRTVFKPWPTGSVFGDAPDCV